MRSGMTSPARILVVFGTRPEAIKLFPVVNALKADPRFECVVCVSAQHREMLDQVLDIAGIVPDHDLDVMKPDQSLDELTARLLTGLGQVMDAVRPDRVIVQGDTATAMTGVSPSSGVVDCTTGPIGSATPALTNTGMRSKS